MSEVDFLTECVSHSVTNCTWSIWMSQTLHEWSSCHELCTSPDTTLSVTNSTCSIGMSRTLTWMIDMSRTLHQSRYHPLCHELYIIHLDDVNPLWMIYMSRTLHESRYHTLCHELYMIQESSWQSSWHLDLCRVRDTLMIYVEFVTAWVISRLMWVRDM